LCTLFPEHGAFTDFVVLGKKEVDKVMLFVEELSSGIREIFKNTEQLHDGRWLWPRILSISQVNDIKMLLKAKRKPNRKEIRLISF